MAYVLSEVLLLLEPGSLAGHPVLYGGIRVVCGVAIPWGYTLLVEGDSISSLGLRREKWKQSLLIGLGLAAFFSLVFVFQTDWSELE